MKPPIFEPIMLQWLGEEFSIPRDQVMPALAAIEDVITIGALARYMSEGNVPLVKVSKAFAVALRFAGARVTDEEVYSAMFAKGEMQKRALEAVQMLQMMMIPPEHLRAAPGKAEQAGKRAGSSRKSTSSS